MDTGAFIVNAAQAGQIKQALYCFFANESQIAIASYGLEKKIIILSHRQLLRWNVFLHSTKLKC